MTQSGGEIAVNFQRQPSQSAVEQVFTRHVQGIEMLSHRLPHAPQHDDTEQHIDTMTCVSPPLSLVAIPKSNVKESSRAHVA